MTPRVLIACIGNIFLGDDAFGVEVARRLERVALPEEAQVVDFGIRGLDLAYALLDGYASVILVDATARGGTPGTLYVLEVPADEPGGEAEVTLGDAHHLDPARVLRLAQSMGARSGRVILVGCEPSPLDESEAFGAELSAPVLAAASEAVPLIASLAARLLRGEEIVAASEEENPIGVAGAKPSVPRKQEPGHPGHAALCPGHPGAGGE